MSVEWESPDEPEDRAELELWCRGVGPPVRHRPPEGDAPATPADEITFVAWNTNVGRGDLDRLVQDLRAGHLTGTPAVHFVLLLQEVYRSGDPVPPLVPDPSRSADRIGADLPDRDRGDIRAFARSQGLHLFYGPSMRNGHPRRGPGADGGDPPEDRGNAILSTLPLSDLQIVELPVRKQRRIVAVATVEGKSSQGEPWRLRVASVHLDHVSTWRRFHRSFGADRADHVERLVAAFVDEPHMVVGGDFNSWVRGNEERAIRLMRSHFPGPADRPDVPTLDAPFFLLSRLLDHLFFRLADGWTGDYTVAAGWYGSDHRPLVGRIRAPASAPPRFVEEAP